MRKTIQILGVGARKSGVSSKTNRPYDFTELSIMHDVPQRFEGTCGEIVMVDQKAIGDIVLVPGMVVDVELWTQNFRSVIGAIYG